MNEGIYIPEQVFRSYEIKGISGLDLSEERMELLGKAYGTYLQQRRIPKIIVGYDNRNTSAAYAQAFIQGLTDTGINVIDVGLTLTQIVYFAQYFYLTKGAAMITASHNSKEYNGLRLTDGYSDLVIDGEMAHLKELTLQGQFYESEVKGIVVKEDVYIEYKNFLLDLYPQKFNFKVVLDCMNATAGKFMPDILRSVGCEVIELNTQLDGNYPSGIPDPTAEPVRKRIYETMKIYDADIGVGYDSDGDRIAIVDKKGRLLHNDVLLALFAQDYLRTVPKGKVIFNSLCSRVVEDVISRSGGIPVRCKTGYDTIKALIFSEHALLAGELSGHFLFMDNFLGHDDGAYTLLRLLSYIRTSKKRLDQLIDALPQYISSSEIRLGCPEDIKVELVDKTIAPQLTNLFKNSVADLTDGIRLDWKTGMVIVRASQNGPYLTVRFEAKTQREYNQLKRKLSEFLCNIPQLDLSYGANLDQLQIVGS